MTINPDDIPLADVAEQRQQVDVSVETAPGSAQTN